ncbi:hypothetical protein G6F49_013520 [Rhizopus delemar]|nr:hypothetical protein G6F49_013520 [Rhizopus delemar]
MTEKEQTYELSVLNESAIPNKSVQENAEVYEDIEMDNVGKTPTTVESSQMEDSHVDAVMNLRVTLENLRQQIARAVVAGAAQEDLLKLQERAVNIQNYIKFLDEAQAFCVPPPPAISEASFSADLSNRNHPPRLNHLIPSDLPVWQWRVGLVWFPSK